MQVVGGLSKGADHDAVDSAQGAQLALHRSDGVPWSSTVSLIGVFCFCQVLGVELSCPFVYCPGGLLTQSIDWTLRPLSILLRPS